MTEIQTLKKKKKEGKATPEELTRLKVLQDGEPVSKSDLAVAEKREADRLAADKAAYEAKHADAEAAHKAQQQVKQPQTITVGDQESMKAMAASGIKLDVTNPASLDVPAAHPRILTLKEALMPFTRIEAHSSRPNEFVLFTRGISITAGDVRTARKAMKV